MAVRHMGRSKLRREGLNPNPIHDTCAAPWAAWCEIELNSSLDAILLWSGNST